MAMLCRVAEDVYWMSRYVERAIAVGRLIDVTWHLELDDGDAADPRRLLWGRLLAPRPNDGPLPESLRGTPDPHAVRHWLAFDRANPRSLVSCVARGRSAARGVRESISSEMWEALNGLHLSLADPDLARHVEDDPYTFYKRIRESAQFIQGLADSTLTHDEAWHFTRLGTSLERADNVAHVLALQVHLLHDWGRDHADETVRWLAVLRSCGSAEAYARFYALRVDPARVVEFLLLNAQFPQTVRYSLRQAWSALEALSGTAAATPAARALGLLSAQLDHAAVDEILEEGLQPYLSGVQRDIARVSDQLTRVYLRDEPQPGRLMPVARAAMLMAAQQQQQQQQQRRPSPCG
jgi:uncharacterized alpha-E superfamily protein